ncbi:MAG: TIR domain-containing protein [Eubacterium sp.]|nr:TIR domain-containing protein [Eubacterium sp.]
MAVFRCKMCGGDLELTDKSTVCECIYCGTKQTVPQINDEKIANLFNRANQLRLVNRFDEAKKIYEDILLENNSSSEAHWGVILCKYGIEYVDDTNTGKKIPTCHRTIASPIFTDIDYIETINNADESNKAVYEEEANKINDIQQGIIKQSENEEDYDIFICYKETDEATGDRTEDSVIAQDLYYELEKKGFKTFFARKTLEGKLGSAYEPIIYSALNSAEVMVVLGTKPEHFNSVWLKNEWSRYLDFAQSGNKLLIPAYRGFSPYELPKEFLNLQALDMGKIGFMQDLIDSITKIFKYQEKENTEKEKQSESFTDSANVSVSSLLKRADMFLLDNNWSSAYEYCEKVLDIEPENHNAYIKKAMAKCHCSEEHQLYKYGKDLMEDSDFKKAVKFSAGEDKERYLSYPQKYYKQKIEQEEQKLSNLYTTNEISGKANGSAVNTCREALKTQKEKYEKMLKKSKIAKIISFAVLAVIYIILLVVTLTPEVGDAAGTVEVSDGASDMVFVLLFVTLFWGIVINGIINCIVAPFKNKMLNTCRAGLTTMNANSSVNKAYYDQVVLQKKIIAADYRALAELGCDVPPEKLEVNIEELEKQSTETITDFNFAIDILQKEDMKMQKAVQNSTMKGKSLKPKKKAVALVLCLIGGIFGFHKFYEGKTGMGVLYIFTLGFFLLGPAHDFFNILSKPNEYY